LHWGTLHKSIARHPIGTMTHSDMVDHIADGIVATGTGTRIAAALADAGQVTWTLGIDGTLRTTMRWSTKVVGQARANGLILLIPARRVEATG